MDYIKKKSIVFETLKTKFKRRSDDYPEILHFLTDKLMVSEFNATRLNKKSQQKDFPLHIFQISVSESLRSLLRGLGVTIYAVTLIFKSSKLRGAQSFTLGAIYALPLNSILLNTSDSDIEDYFDAKIHQLGLEPPDHYYVQTDTKRKTNRNSRISYVRHIGSSVLPLSHQKKSKIILKLLRNLFKWLYISISMPEFLVIGPQYIIDAISFDENSDLQFKYIITTQSTMLCPPIASRFRNDSTKIMFWYSDNSQELRPRKSIDFDEVDYSYLKENIFDFHFVWTQSWAFILKKYSEGKVIVDGPILFNLIKVRNLPKKVEKLSLKVLLFDVTPMKSLESSSHIYNLKSAYNFINDIVEAVNRISNASQIDLKPKRNFSPIHSSKYIEFLENKSEKLNLLAPNQDLPNLILQYDIVICIPFTSPALIAKFLGINTIYYFSNNDFELPLFYEDIPVIIGRDNLSKYLGNI